MSIKIAVVGAGSIGFTRGLMRDILSVPELRDSTFAFTDINKQNLDMITQLARRDIRANKVPAKIVSTVNRRKAIEGADFVVNTTRIGGLEAFRQDVEIPLKYGIDQCVGDTLCAGGIMYGQRNIPAILDFCKDIREVGAPGCMMLNYANPNPMNTWAANHYGGVYTPGLCHGVQGGHQQITNVIELLINGDKNQGDKGFVPVSMKDVDIICAGINHQTWYIQIRYRGEDWTHRMAEGFAKHPVYRKTEKIRIDILNRFGFYTTESNGHVSEYVAWYRKRPRELKQWIDMSSWINGETGGYLRVCTEGRNWFETDFPNWMKEPALTFDAESRSQEHCSYIIESLLTGRVYRGHFNLPNNGCITNLPDDAIVEVPAYVDRNGISVPKVGNLPAGCAAICNASISVQRLAVEAAIHGDVDLLKQAMLMDPLTGAVCMPNEISQMTDEMLIAQEKWLPQYAKVIPAAKARFATEKPLGTKSTRGAARLKTKSVEEMRKNVEQSRQNAAAADKASAKRASQLKRTKTKATKSHKKSSPL
ncbi:MAG: alpha-glucosidase/alpha-galactosidase [Kiritimatiellia bacterium]